VRWVRCELDADEFASRKELARQESDVSDQGVKHSDLVEIAKRSGDFSKNYGRLWGGLLLLSAINAATGRRPFLWGGLIGFATVVGSLVLKYGHAATGG
jgi:hypothetical protein